MRVFIKNLGDLKGEAWVEFWDSAQDEWEIGCRAKLMFMGKKVLIDDIETPIKYRRRGYATGIINELKKEFTEVVPIGIKPTSKEFWEKRGMKDGLGDKR